MKPEWLKIKLETGKKYADTKHIVEMHNLHTICRSGKCPNINQCWNMGTATFMILGDICTRSCKFCATKTGKPLPVNADEPKKIAESVKLMNLKHCVITSVDRDDLPDKGVGQWVDTISAVKNHNTNTTVEVLIPDFDGDEHLLQQIAEAKPDIIGHNLETVERLTLQIRSKAKYKTSLKVLQYFMTSLEIKNITTKTGIMVGLGETKDEVIRTMEDAHTAGVKIFTIGQYLQPTPQHLPVAEYVTPEIFATYNQIGEKIGIVHVESSPLMRSSSMAEETLKKLKS
jgi:lipoic acid synthetase